MAKLNRLFTSLPLVGQWFGSGKRRQPSRTTSKGMRLPAAFVKGEPSLLADDLLRSFGSGQTKTYALQGVSLGLNAGQLNVLMGPSGSGKSTLLAVMSALLRPDSGRVTALGQDLWRMTDLQLEKFRLQHCSYIFQGYNLFPALTARQQLEVVLRWGEGCSGFEARKRADRVLGQLGLSHRANMRPNQLSGGEKQRVAIGRALVKKPSFIFADEPTSALDWENGQQVIELLTDTAKKGTTVLVVTHDPRLLGYAHRVFELADGRLTSDGKPDLGNLNGYEHIALTHTLAGVKPHDHSDSRPCPTCRRNGPRVNIKDHYGQFANC
ncbi:MAG: ABC transporter ATP-binding protein [Gemmataceae bacterium]